MLPESLRPFQGIPLATIAVPATKPVQEEETQVFGSKDSNNADGSARDEWVEERAAIMEYDGGLPRLCAERLARQCSIRDKLQMSDLSGTATPIGNGILQIASMPLGTERQQKGL